jgi:hypothetical protein
MLGRALTRHATGRIAKRVPALKFLAAAEIAKLAFHHGNRLAPGDRRRLGQLLAKASRERRLSDRERGELRRLVLALEPRMFAGGVADALSPVPLPRIVREGRRSKRRR